MELKRRHDAITFKAEKRLLDWMAARIYRHATADQLSLLALAGAALAGISYILTYKSLLFLHLASLGIFIHWLGDSLDGRVARLRDEGRPKYGHYLDHMLDAVSLVVIVFGINYSKLTFLSAWVWVLVLFLLMMIHSFLRSSVTNVFELSFERIGPTEARIGLIIMNTAIAATKNPVIPGLPIQMNLLDLIGVVIALLMVMVLVRSVAGTLWGRNRIREDPKDSRR
jgi:archaetidylinositol phosphate synthase